MYKILQKYSHIIWDWNGTLFDDIDWCVKVINKLLSKRNMKTLNGISEYHSVFGFPIADYYRKIGFDFDVEPFEELAVEYIALYHSNNSGDCRLFPDAENTLSSIKKMGITQVILTASEMNNLLLQMSGFNISGYFDELLGLTDIYGKSKVEIGLDYMKQNQIENAVLIGDSLHDYEAAQALGVDCMLIPNGHQSREKLQTCGVPVLDDISEVVEYISK